MLVALCEEWIIPGRRPEQEAAHREAAAILQRQPGFTSARLLHFSGGPYRYIYEMNWASREDWNRFWSAADFAAYRGIVDKWLQSPFVVQLYDVKVSTD